jgi:hypothetical protein
VGVADPKGIASPTGEPSSKASLVRRNRRAPPPQGGVDAVGHSIDEVNL